MIDPEGHKVEMEYTNAMLSRVKAYYDDSSSYDTTFSYSSNGLLTAVTNANGHSVHSYYDSYGFATSVVRILAHQSTIALTNSVLSRASACPGPVPVCASQRYRVML